MAAQARPALARLTQDLQSAGNHYRFFQLVSLLERFRDKEKDVPIRLLFRPVASLAFQASELAVSMPAGQTDTFIVETPFLGLYGLSSPLPAYYTEDLLDDAEESQVLRGFLDLFNHRSHQLLQAVWEKYRCYLNIRPAADDEATEQIAALARLGRQSGYPFRYVDRRRLLPLTGMLSFCSGSARVIEAVLRDYFALPGLYLEENVVRFARIPEDQQNRLGMDYASLGQDIALGEEIKDCSSAFRLQVRDVDLKQALSFHPTRSAYQELKELVDYLSPVALDFTITFQVRASSVPLCSLDGGIELGFNALLGVADDSTITLEF